MPALLNDERLLVGARAGGWPVAASELPRKTLFFGSERAASPQLYIYTARILIPAEWLCGSIDRLRGYGPDGDDEDAHEPANNKAVATTTTAITPTNAGAVAGGAITVAAGAGAGAPRIPEPQLTPRQQARI